MKNYEPDNQVTFSRRTQAGVLFIAACFLGLGLLLRFYGV